MFRDVYERSGVFMAREMWRLGNPRATEGNVDHDTLVVIPAHNEAATVVQVARRARQACPFADVIVVNDGSQDETGELCHCAGIPVIDLPVNLGLAGAFRTGMQYAMRHGYRFAVQLDADGQHDPTAVEPMRERALSGANIVLGSRFLDNAMPLTLRTIGSRLLRVAMRAVTGRWVTDPTCGMRLYDAGIIREFAMRSYFTPEPDTIAHLMRRGAVTAEVPVPLIERTRGESYLGMRRAILYMASVLLSLLVFPRESAVRDVTQAGYGALERTGERR
jgi:glycosyltransferase involved in cell wall biosynthesis